MRRWLGRGRSVGVAGCRAQDCVEAICIDRYVANSKIVALARG